MFINVEREELTADAMKLFNQHKKRLDAKSEFKSDAGSTGNCFKTVIWSKPHLFNYNSLFVPPFCFLCMF